MLLPSERAKVPSKLFIMLPELSFKVGIHVCSFLSTSKIISERFVSVTGSEEDVLFPPVNEKEESVNHVFKELYSLNLISLVFPFTFPLR